MRRRRGLLTRWELAVGLVLLLALAAWARPKVLRWTWRTRRAEADAVLETLAEHQVATRRRTGRYAALGPFPRPESAVDRLAVAWTGLPEGFTPPLPSARCAYRAEVGEGVLLVATCDVDGDGARSVTTLVPGELPRRPTGEDVY